MYIEIVQGKSVCWWNLGLCRGRAEHWCCCISPVGGRFHHMLLVFYIYNADFSVWKQVTLGDLVHTCTCFVSFKSIVGFPTVHLLPEGQEERKGKTHHKLVLFCQKRSYFTPVCVSGRWFIILMEQGYFEAFFCPGPSFGWQRLAFWGHLGKATQTWLRVPAVAQGLS